MSRKTAAKTADQPSLVIDNDKAAVPAVQQPGGAVAVAAADPMLSLIERLAKDPTFDVEKMERLIAMKERGEAAHARAEFDQAMALAQQEMMTIIAKSKSDKGKYASYATLDKAIRPIYTRHGFSVSFDTDPGAPELTVRLVATVGHRGGHRERRQLDVPADGKGARGGDVMTRTHATASAVTYGKRYLQSMIWNLAVDKDDDGEGASSNAEKAQVMADSGIQYLNTANLDKNGLEAYREKQKKNIDWLKSNAPEQFERFQIAYSNAAEAAGIKKEEPKRGDKDKTSTAATPHSKPSQGGVKLAREDDQGAGSVRTSEASGTPPAITDVIEFDTFNTAREFLDFSSGWMADPKRTKAEAEQWYAHYKDKITEYLKHEFPNKKVSWIKDSMTDTFAEYVKLTSAGG